MENALIPVPIPETVPEIMAQLGRAPIRSARFIDRGSFAEHLRAGVSGQGLALALDARKDTLPADKRRIARARDRRSSCGPAYLLDAFGDHRQQAADRRGAFRRSRRRSKDIQASFPEK